MNAYDRRLDRLESTLPLTDDLEAMLERVAAVVGIPPDGLRADAWRSARGGWRLGDRRVAVAVFRLLDGHLAVLQVTAKQFRFAFDRVTVTSGSARDDTHDLSRCQERSAPRCRIGFLTINCNTSTTSGVSTEEAPW